MTILPLGWLRGFAVFLAVPQLVTGAWAVFAPRGFYDEFPGFGPLLVAAEPPFNAHLTTDAGSGFLATGAALLIAAVTGVVGHLRLALAAYAVFAVPHFVYHATHPAPGLSAAEDVVNAVVLGAAAVLPVVLLLLTRSRKDSDDHSETDLEPREGDRKGAPEPR